MLSHNQLCGKGLHFIPIKTVESLRGECVSVTDTRTRLTQDILSGTGARKRHTKIQWCCKKLHLQVVSHSLYFTGTTVLEFTPTLLFSNLLGITAILHFFHKQCISECNFFFFYRCLVSQKTAKRPEHKPACDIALPCILSSSQMCLAFLRGKQSWEANQEHLSLC